MKEFWHSIEDTVKNNKEQMAEVVCGALSVKDMAEITKNLPVIEWVVKTYGIVTAFQSVYFHKKLLRFIKNTTEKNVNLEELYSMVSQMQEKSYDDGLAVFFKVIDEVYTMQQIDIISNLTIAYNNKNISEVDFFRLISITRRCIADDLYHLISFTDKSYIEGVAESLNSFGLISIVDHEEEKNPLYQINNTGYKMLRWGIGNHNVDIKPIKYNIGRTLRWEYIGEGKTLEINDSAE